MAGLPREKVHEREGDKVKWRHAAPSRNKLPDSLYEAAFRLRQGLEEVIQAGVSGAL